MQPISRVPILLTATYYVPTLLVPTLKMLIYVVSNGKAFFFTFVGANLHKANLIGCNLKGAQFDIKTISSR